MKVFFAFLNRERAVRSLIQEVIAGILVLLFSYTAISKLSDLDEFRREMLNQPFPEWMGHMLVWILPATELITTALLAFKNTRLVGMCFSSALMLMFTGYVVLVLLDVFGRIPCSCGGILENTSWDMHLIFNILFTLIALTGMVLSYKERRV